MDQISESKEASAFPKSESEVAPPQSAGASVTGAGVAAFAGISTRIGRYRWVICALLFFAATLKEERIASPGDVLHFPSNCVHGATMMDEEVVLIDIFTPLREDFLDDNQQR